MEILIWVGAFIISLAVLIKAADLFTDTAERIGLHFKMPPFIIGVTIVALGTSLPELATSMIAVLQGKSEIVIGNVIGSNIANILFVLAITAIVSRRLIVDKDIINIDLPILLGSTILLFLTTLDGKFTYIDGTICLLTLVTYILYNTKTERKVDTKEMQEISNLKRKEKAKEKKDGLSIKYPILLLLSGIFISLSAHYTIKSVTELSTILKIGEEIIAITAIAIGTSLPELATSLVAARKGKADIAIGNVTGSNIFNALGVMGIPALMGNIYIPATMISFTIPALLFITILYIFVIMDKQITQWEGITLLFLYIAFIGKTLGFI